MYNASATFNDQIPSDPKSVFKRAFRVFKDQISSELKNTPNTAYDHNLLNAQETKISHAFSMFLQNMDYPVAQKNFEILKTEKSAANGKSIRDDGSVNWYHELIPLFTLLTMASQGSQNGGFDIEDLEPYGGLEMLICTYLRHDSKEDFKSLAEIEQEQRDIIATLSPNQGARYADHWIETLSSNIDLVSQQRIQDGSPKGAKVSTLEYYGRMKNDPKASPIVALVKMMDNAHNLGTMFLSRRYDGSPEKRLSKCNDIEDIYGNRMNFTKKYGRKWPDFAGAFNTIDGIIGTLLFPTFRYLSDVDLHYKAPCDEAVEIEDYAKKAMRLDIVPELNIVHNFFGRMAHSVPHTDPEKRARLDHFMENVIKGEGALGSAKLRRHFGYLFASNQNASQAALSTGKPSGAVFAPNFQ